MYNKFKTYIEERWGLVTTWKCWYKWWSNQLVIIGTLLVSLAPEVSMYAMEIARTYDQLPMGVQLVLPESLIRGIGIVIIIVSIPARVVKQKRLPQE